MDPCRWGDVLLLLRLAFGFEDVLDGSVSLHCYPILGPPLLLNLERSNLADISAHVPVFIVKRHLLLISRLLLVAIFSGNRKLYQLHF